MLKRLSRKSKIGIPGRQASGIRRRNFTVCSQVLQMVSGDTKEPKRSIERHLRAQGSSKRASKAQRKDILDLLSFGVDEASVRRACTQQPSSRAPFDASRGNASLVSGK